MYMKKIIVALGYFVVHGKITTALINIIYSNVTPLYEFNMFCLRTYPFFSFVVQQ